MSKFLQQGARLKEERERLRFSQIDFAKIGGAGRKSQFNYESGESAPDGVYLSAIAAIGADVLYILTGERGGVLTKDEQELLALFRAAPLAVKAAAIGALHGGITPTTPGNKIRVSAKGNATAAGRDVINQKGN